MLRIKGNAPPQLPPEEEMPPLPEEAPLPEEEAPLPEEAPPPINMTLKKVDPAIALYKGSELGPFLCANCDYFNEEDSSCDLVDGPIDPEGVCNLFTPLAKAEEVAPVEEEAPVEEPLPEEPIEGSEEMA